MTVDELCRFLKGEIRAVDKEGRIVKFDGSYIVDNNGMRFHHTIQAILSYQFTPCERLKPGDDRRFNAACAALTGFISDPTVSDSIEKYAEWSVRHADALLAELGKDKS